MKTKLIVMAVALFFATVCGAKDIKTVVLKTAPEMHCANCENKIKNNIRFEKGIKDIITNLEDKTVTIKYDADKTTVENIIVGFAKIGYKATVAEDDASCHEDVQSSCDSCADKTEKTDQASR